MANEELREHNKEKVLQTAFELYTKRGLEHVRQDDIAQASGISKSSLNRYFVNKTDLVVQTAVWVGQQLDSSREFHRAALSDRGRSGIELLAEYMHSTKRLFLRDTMLFVLLAEYETYVYRCGEDAGDANKRLENALFTKVILREILQRVKNEQDLSSGWDVREEADFISRSFYGFLINLALHAPDLDLASKQIERFIEHTLDYYRVTPDQKF